MKTIILFGGSADPLTVTRGQLHVCFQEFS